MRYAPINARLCSSHDGGYPSSSGAWRRTISRIISGSGALSTMDSTSERKLSDSPLGARGLHRSMDRYSPVATTSSAPSGTRRPTSRSSSPTTSPMRPSTTGAARSVPRSRRVCDVSHGPCSTRRLASQRTRRNEPRLPCPTILGQADGRRSRSQKRRNSLSTYPGASSSATAVNYPMPSLSVSKTKFLTF